MPITNATGKTASRPQPAPLVEPAGAKSVKDNITVLKEQPQTISDANDTQRPALSQKAMGKRPDEEENNDFIFSKSSIITRTPTQMCCTPPDVTAAPKKKETTLSNKLR